jgi:hypothetical protein
MGLFLSKGAKPVAAVADADFSVLAHRFAEFIDDTRCVDVEIALVTVLADKMGSAFTPQVYDFLKYEADEAASLLANDAFLALSEGEMITLVLVHFTVALRGLGLESPNLYGIENVLTQMVASSVLLIQAGRGHPTPRKQQIDDLRAYVGAMLAEQHTALTRDHAPPIMAALTVASVTHPEATKLFTGGLEPQPQASSTARVA